eukprot:4934166-Pyramimonas_sp.AAC.1
MVRLRLSMWPDNCQGVFLGDSLPLGAFLAYPWAIEVSDEDHEAGNHKSRRSIALRVGGRRWVTLRASILFPEQFCQGVDHCRRHDMPSQ